MKLFLKISKLFFKKKIIFGWLGGSFDKRFSCIMQLFEFWLKVLDVGWRCEPPPPKKKYIYIYIYTIYIHLFFGISCKNSLPAEKIQKILRRKKYSFNCYRWYPNLEHLHASLDSKIDPPYYTKPFWLCNFVVDSLSLSPRVSWKIKCLTAKNYKPKSRLHTLPLHPNIPSQI